LARPREIEVWVAFELDRIAKADEVILVRSVFETPFQECVNRQVPFLFRLQSSPLAKAKHTACVSAKVAAEKGIDIRGDSVCCSRVTDEKGPRLTGSM